MGDIMNKELTTAQQKAIQALMLENTMVVAAERAKISETSILSLVESGAFSDCAHASPAERTRSHLNPSAANERKRRRHSAERPQ